MMSGATVMIPTGLESLREPKQPIAAIEYEYRSAEYEYEYEEQPEPVDAPKDSVGSVARGDVTSRPR